MNTPEKPVVFPDCYFSLIRLNPFTQGQKPGFTDTSGAPYYYSGREKSAAQLHPQSSIIIVHSRPHEWRDKSGKKDPFEKLRREFHKQFAKQGRILFTPAGRSQLPHMERLFTPWRILFVTFQFEWQKNFAEVDDPFTFLVENQLVINGTNLPLTVSI